MATDTRQRKGGEGPAAAGGGGPARAEKQRATPAASKWHRALDPTTQWDKAELHEVVYWVRQVLAVVCGLLWGFIPLTGYVGNLTYLGLSGLALFVFFAKYHRTVDPEWYWPLTQEGYLPAYALFLVVWIVAFNTFSSTPHV
jgi:hypothetical protein